MNKIVEPRGCENAPKVIASKCYVHNKHNNNKGRIRHANVDNVEWNRNLRQLSRKTPVNTEGEIPKEKSEENVMYEYNY